MIERVDNRIEHSLDIRSIIRLQSITLTIVRCLFTSDHYPLLALQRGGDLLDLDEHKNEADRLVYGNKASKLRSMGLARLRTALLVHNEETSTG